MGNRLKSLLQILSPYLCSYAQKNHKEPYKVSSNSAMLVAAPKEHKLSLHEAPSVTGLLFTMAFLLFEAICVFASGIGNPK